MDWTSNWVESWKTRIRVPSISRIFDFNGTAIRIITRETKWNEKFPEFCETIKLGKNSKLEVRFGKLISTIVSDKDIRNIGSLSMINTMFRKPRLTVPKKKKKKKKRSLVVEVAQLSIQYKPRYSVVAGPTANKPNCNGIRILNKILVMWCQNCWSPPYNLSGGGGIKLWLHEFASDAALYPRRTWRRKKGREGRDSCSVYL